MVAGCSSYNVGLSEILSELPEGVYKVKKDKVGLISSDDFLANLHQFNDRISKKGYRSTTQATWQMLMVKCLPSQ